MTNRLLCLISVGSTRFSSELLEAYCKFAKEVRLVLNCIILDGPERHNVRAFDGLEELDAERVASERATKYIASIAPPGLEIFSWRDVLVGTSYEEVRGKVYEAFEGSARFRRECLNETFRNLQPRFRRAGVLKKSHPKVGTAVHYFLEELALKVTAFSEKTFAGEIAPRVESSLVLSLYRGKYFPIEQGMDEYRLIVNDGLHAEETILVKDLNLIGNEISSGPRSIL